MATVNLDALIPREDLEIKEESNQSLSSQTIQIRDLEKDAFIYGALRRPDFQRETSDWSPKRVSDFILSFLSGDLISSAILWNSGQYLFTIDGAHRLVPGFCLIVGGVVFRGRGTIFRRSWRLQIELQMRSQERPCAKEELPIQPFPLVASLPTIS